jgi:hypothetical protein
VRGELGVSFTLDLANSGKILAIEGEKKAPQ